MKTLLVFALFALAAAQEEAPADAERMEMPEAKALPAFPLAYSAPFAGYNHFGYSAYPYAAYNGLGYYNNFAYAAAPAAYTAAPAFAGYNLGYYNNYNLGYHGLYNYPAYPFAPYPALVAAKPEEETMEDEMAAVEEA